MKRYVFTIVLAIQTLAVLAQPRALGVRAGLEYQLSYEHALAERPDFIEAEAGYQLLGNGFNVAAAYNFMVVQLEWTARGQWGFYIGPAVKAGFFGAGCYVAAGAQIGLEYNFDFPLQLSIDTRPAVGAAIVNRSASLYGGESVIGAIPCLSVRYRFGR